MPVPVAGSQTRVRAAPQTGGLVLCPSTPTDPKDPVPPRRPPRREPGSPPGRGWDGEVTLQRRGPHLSSLVSQVSPTRSLSISVWRRAEPSSADTPGRGCPAPLQGDPRPPCWAGSCPPPRPPLPQPGPGYIPEWGCSFQGNCHRHPRRRPRPGRSAEGWAPWGSYPACWESLQGQCWVDAPTPPSLA